MNFAENVQDSDVIRALESLNTNTLDCYNTDQQKKGFSIYLKAFNVSWTAIVFKI